MAAAGARNSAGTSSTISRHATVQPIANRQSSMRRSAIANRQSVDRQSSIVNRQSVVARSGPVCLAGGVGDDNAFEEGDGLLEPLRGRHDAVFVLDAEHVVVADQPQI